MITLLNAKDVKKSALSKYKESQEDEKRKHTEYCLNSINDKLNQCMKNGCKGFLRLDYKLDDIEVIQELIRSGYEVYHSKKQHDSYNLSPINLPGDTYTYIYWGDELDAFDQIILNCSKKIYLVNGEIQYNDKEKKDMTTMMDKLNNGTADMFKGLFGKVEAGKCRLGINGDIAVQTANGYKTYDVETGKLVNCANFCFDIGTDMFFVIPTNKVEKGDIVLVNGRPRCVREIKDKNSIEVFNYDDNSIETIVPERHVFMGSTYFYGKIVSMFGKTNFLKGKKGTNKMMQLMMMSQMMGSSNNMFSNMMPFMLMNGNMGNMFEGMFDFGFDDEEDNE